MKIVKRSRQYPDKMYLKQAYPISKDQLVLEWTSDSADAVRIPQALKPWAYDEIIKPARNAGLDIWVEIP